ncbi:MAG: IclR family transcriptional regulator [Marinomonas sp.]|uniref:IclR family transcriptional regulator n=1 Tax=unclassified Marinomonas TaxID=196814 RepID=UPI002934C5E4|nr:IclR family transcriptional regulator [Marinomonas sp. GJ51-6]WOD08264.1 IclR family transcriptional regulator [Marinomonas sp. GJ51-6]
MAQNEKSKAPAVDGAVLIIDLLASAGFPLTLSEICEQTGLPSASCHRILNALLDHQMVALNMSRKKSYSIGSKIFQVASTIYSKQSLIPFFYPIAEILKNEIHKPIFLSIPVGDTVVVVSKLESSLNSAFNLHIGQTLPLYSSASGKAILSMYSETQQQNYLNGQKRVNPKIVEELPKIKEDLGRAKRLGYAVSQGEIEHHVSSIAAPILNLRNEPIAAISTGISDEFLSDQNARDYSKRLIQAARQLSSRIV